MVGCDQLGGCHRMDAVSEVEARDLGAQTLPAGASSAYPVGVDRRGQLQRREGLVLNQRPSSVLGQRLVDFEESALGCAHDAPAPAAVQHEIVISTLQA